MLVPEPGVTPGPPMTPALDDPPPPVGGDAAGSLAPVAEAPPPLRGGELNAAITSAIVGIHNHHLGRGPRSASTFHRDNVVVTLLHEVMTRAERVLSTRADESTVIQMRHHFQMAMREDFIGAVERLTGAKVISFISGNSTDPDVASEVFLLDRPVGASAAANGARR